MKPKNPHLYSQPDPELTPAIEAPRRPSFKYIAIDIMRHAIPLLPLYLFHGTVTAYVLLTAFDLSLGLMLIVVSTRDPKDPTTVDPRSRWLVLRIIDILLIMLILGSLAAILSVPILVPAFFFGLSEKVDSHLLLSNPGFWIPVVAMTLLAAVKYQLGFEATTVPGPRGQPTRQAPVIGNLEQDRKNALAAYAAQVTLIATFIFLCYALIIFGSLGRFVLPILYAGVLVFYDIRPDLAQSIFPALWKRK